MKNLKYTEIRRKYLDYLISKGHHEIPSAPLVPENDPTLLFVNSGMFPIIPYLLGEKHPNGTRLTDSQRSLRTGDIEDVGDASHCTTFEMLGNWSLNDYFKEEAINITTGFLLDELEFDVNRLYGTVFVGDNDAPKDTVSIDVWKKIFKERGIEAKVGNGEKIQEYDKSKNWWELEAGGPCGPCSELFYDTLKEPCGPNCHVNCDCGKFIEIGNNVFMEYLKKDGKYSPLGRHNVDFGGGLDRLVMFSQGVDNYFETDIYAPIFKKVDELSSNSNILSQRVITDHIKASTWIIADGVVPGRTAQGYILRRLIRRSIRHARKLGIEGLFTKLIGEIAIDQFSTVHPLLTEKKEQILNVLEEEEKNFNHTLDNGLREFEKIFIKIQGKKFLNSQGESFKLYETYGFPLEMTLEELKTRGIEFNEEEVKKLHEDEFAKHQDKSRQSTTGLFKGGLADTSEMSTKYHTATHLLLSALHKVLGNHIYQKGSNITPERLRLDFPNDVKVTDDQLKEIENLINEQIQKDLPVTYEEMNKEDALKIVKYAAFAEKYSDVVKVYTIGTKDNPFSIEICGGPHVENLSSLGKFKIVKEESVAAGIRRIKAILE
jgi:alanyl-tRNA synthetase